MHAGGGFFGYALDLGQALGIPTGLAGQAFLDRVEQADFFFGTWIAQYRCILFGACAEMQQQRRVATVVQDHVRIERAFGSVRPFKDAMCEFPVIVQRLALECEHWRAGSGNSGGGMILGRINVA